MDTFGPLVSVDWLRDHLSDADLRVVDLRWYLDGRSSRDAYSSGHVPGAVFGDLEGPMTGHGEGGGRHPLPTREAFEQAMRELGVDASTRVVVYDDQGGMVAGRLWWLLRYFGHDAVALLDGGLGTWSGELEVEEARPEPGDFVALPPRTDRALDYAAVRDRDPSTLLLDARAGERFRGEREPVEPRAGHIPGARSAPFAENLTPDGHFRSPEALRSRYQGLGVERGSDAVVYCGSGVSACNDLIALELAGLTGARLYPGSWSDWSRRAEAPVATGS